MPARLTKEGDLLILRLSGLPRDEFFDALAKVKTITGKRFNDDDPEDKYWELPADAETAVKAVYTIEPEIDAQVREMVKSAQTAIAEELVTRVPEDAELEVPWAEELFPFQRAGVDWLVTHPHAILADEMGLGKTVECISAVQEDRMRRGHVDLAEPTLVVCPNSVRGVWKAELERWAGIDAVVIDGGKAARQMQVATAVADHAEYIIVNWEKLRLMPELAKVKWYAVIADEAHRAKNRKAQQTKALWKLRAPIQIAASGTPIMNSPDELWAILKWLKPEQYTSYWAFEASFVEGYQGYYGKVVTGVRNPDALRFELEDKLIRRTKVQTKDEIGYVGKLPPEVIEVPLHPKQQRAYDEAEKAVWLDIEEAMADPDKEPSEKARLVEVLKSGDDRALGILLPNTAARLVRQRQIATSPAILGAEDHSATLDAAQEQINDHPGKPFVVFCWYKPTAELIAARLRRQKPAIKCDVLHGDVPAAARDQVVEDFQQGETQVLIATIMTGGAGITLTRADTCIFVEEDWTPANNQQAIDRLDRIGQKAWVTTIKIRARDTIHTKRIVPKNQLKELMTETVLGAQEASTP